MSPSSPSLRALYRRLYFSLPWPAPLPAPEEVRACWNRRFRGTAGACLRNQKIIKINVIYQDPRLGEELEYLVIHEAAHFIWKGHPRAFTKFLESVGVPESYVVSASEPSEIYRLVHAERAQRGQLPLFGVSDGGWSPRAPVAARLVTTDRASRGRVEDDASTSAR